MPRHTLALSAALLGRSLFAQTPVETPGAAPPVIRTETRVVLVDAVVTDKNGKYLRDLKPSDFHVFEDDKEQKVSSFTFEGNRTAPADDRKHYVVLVFDNSTMRGADQVQARKAATEFITANAGPDRLIAIADFNGAMRIRQNFTDDVVRLKQVVSGTQVSTAASSAPGGNVPQLTGLDNRYGQFSPILALRDLVKNLAPVNGRKTLVLLTGGYEVSPTSLPELNALVDAGNKANVAIYPVDVRGIGTTSAPSAAPELSSPRAQRGRTAVPNRSVLSLDTDNAEPASPPAQVTQQSLNMLGHNTGGFVILNTNDFTQGMTKIAKEQDEYYLLGYAPPLSSDKSCHTLKVKIEKSGAQVRARTGYCNVKQKEVLAGKPIERDLEAHATAPAGKTAASIKLPFFYTGPNQAHVLMALEIPPGSINFEKDKGKFHATLNVLGLAYPAGTPPGPERAAVARFSDVQDLYFSDQKEVDAFKAGKRFRYEYQFDIASGNYDLNVAFNSGAQNFGNASSPLAIDGWDGKQFNLSGIALSSDVRPAGQGGDLEAALRDDRKVLLCRGMQVSASGSNNFHVTEKPGLFIEAYSPRLLDPKPPAIAVALRVFDSKSGEKKFDSGFFSIADSIQPGNPVVPLLLALPMNALSPGSYRVEVNAGEADGSTSLARYANFEIEP